MLLFQTMKLQFLAESMAFNVNCYPPEKYEDGWILDWEWCQTSWNSSLLAVLVWWSNQTTFCIYTHISSIHRSLTPIRAHIDAPHDYRKVVTIQPNIRAISLCFRFALPITDIIARVSINTIVVIAKASRIQAAVPPSVIWKLNDRSFFPKTRWKCKTRVTIWRNLTKMAISSDKKGQK